MTLPKKVEYRYFDREVETLSVEELHVLQLERLQSALARADQNECYHRKFQEQGLSPTDLRYLEDLQRFPFTTKEDILTNYPTGLMACAPVDVVRYHMSSGTTGKPKVIPYTPQDIKTWAQLMARTLAAVGITAEDVVQNCYGYGLFTGGLGFHYGAEALGATVIPSGAGSTERQIQTMLDMGTTVITCTPSYAIHLGETLQARGIQPQDLRVRIGHHGAEPWTEQIRQRIEALWGFAGKGGGAYDIYGLSEMCGPGVATECQAQEGLHLWADHFIPEIIDPQSGEPLRPGERGELVLTSITREAMPLIRYRTGDITSILPEPCPCGRTHPRMERIAGRADDMLIIRGVNVFPSQIEHVLMERAELASAYLIVVDRRQAMVELSVQVEPQVGTTLSEDFQAHLERVLQTKLGLRCTAEIKQAGELPRFEGKAKRVQMIE
ncbi:MAG TPA: phenylacetate--CoA ligase family protein [Candidatus Fraserbacteria bacterium]|nr:phenylacetate--CoA ligase family protein [Candidatus Fraserbacteria bacterium]